MAVLFKVAQFVDVLINGNWIEAIVQAVRFYGKRVSYLVCLIDQARDVAVSQENVRASSRFEQMLSQELEIEMLEPEEPPSVSQAPWNDKDDFVDPIPMVAPQKKTTPGKRPSRFQILTEEEIDALQRGSKSASTHKHTQWALKIFRG